MKEKLKEWYINASGQNYMPFEMLWDQIEKLSSPTPEQVGKDAIAVLDWMAINHYREVGYDKETKRAQFAQFQGNVCCSDYFTKEQLYKLFNPKWAGQATPVDDAEEVNEITFEQVFDGDWIEPKPQKGHKMKCCDCGLIHTINFRVENGKVQFQAFRESVQRSPINNAATPATPSMQWVKINEDESNLPEDIENCFWCKYPVFEPPYCGSMADDDFTPNYFTHYMRIPNEFFPSENPSPIPVKDRADYLKQKVAEHLGVPELKTSDAYAIEWAVKNLNV